ncbi:DUF2752 domain-containing protein [Poriferisphaera sp. WC338]|uniref:DUF2752 domain-containing protein n=1 Tax=Poriferisphaera sp. WC338 TaxID=3425129 RepID=UPI003D812937
MIQPRPSDILFSSGMNESTSPTPTFASPATPHSRLPALAIFLSCLILLAVGSYLSPTFGLTEAFNMPVCGFKLHTGLPCLTCGMTTAFTHATHGHLLTAFYTQPFGAALAIATAAFFLISLWSLITGMSLAPLGRMLGSRKFIIPLIAFFILAWLFTLVTNFTPHSG